MCYLPFAFVPYSFLGFHFTFLVRYVNEVAHSFNAIFNCMTFYLLAHLIIFNFGSCHNSLFDHQKVVKKS